MKLSGTVTVLFLLLLAAPASAFNLTNLENVWEMEDNLDTMNNTNLTLQGTPTVITGLLNQGYGTGTGKSLYAEGTDFTGAETYWTITIWMNATSSSKGSVPGSYYIGSTYQWYWYINTPEGTARVDYNPAITIQDTGLDITDETWHLITFGRNDTDVWLQVDDRARVSHTAVQIVNGVGTKYLDIGSHLHTSSWFPGGIDQSTVWKRSLSKAEVDAIFNSGSGIAYPFGEEAECDPPGTPTVIEPGNESYIAPMPISWDPSATNCTITNYTVDLLWPNETFYQFLINTTEYGATMTEPSTGQYRIRVTAWDDQGGSSSSTSPPFTILPHTPPSEPYVTLPGNLTYSFSFPLTIECSEAYDGATVTNYTITLFNASDNAELGTLTPTGYDDGTLCLYPEQYFEIGDGQFYVNATVEDSYGGTSQSQSATFSILEVGALSCKHANTLYKDEETTFLCTIVNSTGLSFNCYGLTIDPNTNDILDMTPRPDTITDYGRTSGFQPQPANGSTQNVRIEFSNDKLLWNVTTRFQVVCTDTDNPPNTYTYLYDSRPLFKLRNEPVEILVGTARSTQNVVAIIFYIILAFIVFLITWRVTR